MDTNIVSHEINLFKALYSKALDAVYDNDGNLDITCRNGFTFRISPSNIEDDLCYARGEYEDLDATSNIQIFTKYDSGQTFVGTVAEKFKDFSPTSCENLTFDDVTELIKSCGGLAIESFIAVMELYGYAKYY